MQNGDQVIEIEGKPIYYFEELRATIKNRTDDSIALVWLRNQDTMRATIVLGSEGLLGLAPEDRFVRDKIEYGFFAAFVPGTKSAFGVIFDTFKGFRKIFKGEVSASNSVAGPVRIAGMIGVNFQRDGWIGFWMLTGMLSMALAFMNILPIPALDGGHVVFLLIEMVIRREPSLKIRMIAQQAGMIILLALMAFVIFNDIIATVFK